MNIFKNTILSALGIIFPWYLLGAGLMTGGFLILVFIVGDFIVAALFGRPIELAWWVSWVFPGVILPWARPNRPIIRKSILMPICWIVFALFMLNVGIGVGLGINSYQKRNENVNHQIIPDEERQVQIISGLG